MKAPGSAYDDPVLGKDPQPATFADYVQTTGDNGGVHLNSGIPNRAFYLAATAIGGNAWEGAGAGLVRHDPRRAAAPHHAVRRLRPGDRADRPRVRHAGRGRGRLGAGRGHRRRDRLVRLERLEFQRTGGFAGLTLSTTVDPGDPQLADLSGMLSGVDVPALTATAPALSQADRFTYLLVMEVDQTRYELSCGEHELPAPLEPVVQLLLDRARRP